MVSRKSRGALLFGWLLCTCGGGAQIASPSTGLPVTPMPPDRAEDSYTIYSQLMPGKEYEPEGWPRKLWLIEETTATLVPPEQSCSPDVPGELENPHNAVKAPADREADLQEVLRDFDRHCHERITLTPESFRLPVPFRLLDDASQRRFWESRLAKPGQLPSKEFDGAPGLNSFSEVYFNAHHTLAMVFAGQPCGPTCGSWYWVVLEKTDGQWRSLPWVTAMTMS